MAPGNETRHGEAEPAVEAGYERCSLIEHPPGAGGFEGHQSARQALEEPPDLPRVAAVDVTRSAGERAPRR